MQFVHVNMFTFVSIGWSKNLLFWQRLGATEKAFSKKLFILLDSGRSNLNVEW